VKGANGGARILRLRLRPLCFGSGDELGHALTHFAGGFICEGYAKDISRGYSLLDHVRDAEGDDPGLTGSCPREDEDRPADSLDRVPLLRVQGIQIQHRVWILIRVKLKASGFGRGRNAGEHLVF